MQSNRINKSTDLSTIYSIINKGTKDNPYNIYVTDKNLIIINSTYQQDIGFDLNFAKKSFDEHFQKNIIGVCSPIFEKSSKKFISYTDSYIDKKKSAILQVSFTYKKTKKKLLEIQKLLSKYPNIVDVKTYIITNTGFINDIILQDFTSYKPKLNEILTRIKNGVNIENKLMQKNLLINRFVKDGIRYKALYLVNHSSIDDDTKILYSIVMNEKFLAEKLRNLNIFIFIIIVLGVFSILAMSRLRKKEIKLTEQDKFIQSSMHEIKTPLSIITLNNELRELEFGTDEYTKEIDSAIKTLKTSYEDMSFTLTKGHFSYPIELLNLSDILQERIGYFRTIAECHSKHLVVDINSKCNIKISRIELIRLIDNNLSNAIKYSYNNSNITVTLKNNTLTFHNIGKPINNDKKIFDKYFRENIIIGGHGLGLAIVKEITKKYSISIQVHSTDQNGTLFQYKFTCHSNKKV